MSNVIDFKSYDFNHMSLTISSFKVFIYFKIYLLITYMS